MNLRNLFNPTRFEGCVNGRMEFPLFQRAEDAPRMDLFCQELADGQAALMAYFEGRIVSPLTFDLPEHLRGRIEFWNKWISYALEVEYERFPSLYGLESYGISIAMELAGLFPKSIVCYGGLPVNAEQLLPAYVNSFSSWDEMLNHMPPPPVDVLNPYMKRLLASIEPVSQIRNCHFFCGWYDEYYAALYFRTYTETVSERFYIEESEGFPRWMEQRMDGLGNLYMWQCNNSLLMPFWEDALSVDITRFIRPLLPVSYTKRYITGEDVMDVCRDS